MKITLIKEALLNGCELRVRPANVGRSQAMLYSASIHFPWGASLGTGGKKSMESALTNLEQALKMQPWEMQDLRNGRASV